MVQIEDGFYLRFEFEIIVIQKKFGKYFAMTNIYKRDKDCTVELASNTNLVSCIVGDILEINEIHFDEKKTYTKMLDFIDLNKSIG